MKDIIVGVEVFYSMEEEFVDPSKCISAEV